MGADVSAVRHFHGAALAIMVIASTPARAQDGCRFVTIGSASVRAASEAGIALDDGRVVRLAGIELAENAHPAPAGEIVLKRLGERGYAWLRRKRDRLRASQWPSHWLALPRRKSVAGTRG